MSWRRVVWCCCLGVVIGCASGHAVEVTPCENLTPMGPRRLYLGDGVTDYHDYPILDYLRENPGSESNTRALGNEERAAAQSPHDLKPPSSSILETEFSHLLEAVARDNGGIGAAVFDMTGLKVGLAGLQMEGLVLPADRRATLEKGAGRPTRRGALHVQQAARAGQNVREGLQGPDHRVLPTGDRPSGARFQVAGLQHARRPERPAVQGRPAVTTPVRCRPGILEGCSRSTLAFLRSAGAGEARLLRLGLSTRSGRWSRG